jgi:hypothetical protein
VQWKPIRLAHDIEEIPHHGDMRSKGKGKRMVCLASLIPDRVNAAGSPIKERLGKGIFLRPQRLHTTRSRNGGHANPQKFSTRVIRNSGLHQAGEEYPRASRTKSGSGRDMN